VKPLQAIGVGMIWIILTTRGTTVDWFPAPIGWAVILLGLPGLRRQPEIAPYWRTLVTIALIAMAASIVLWLPVADTIIDGEPAMGWALDLPKFAFFILLCHALAKAAAACEEDPYRGSAVNWLRLTQYALIAVAVAPILVFGAGWEAIGGHAAFAAQAMMLMMLVLCFSYGSRLWAIRQES
jgi:hypothetical protein